MIDKEQINKCQCSCDDCGAECEPFWKKENKEKIIINGVDINQCNFLCTDGTCACAFTDLLCKHKEEIEKYCLYNHNCYFKQLACKTQECEELKSKMYDLRQLRELDREARVRFYNQVCEYRKALEEIEKICLEDTYTFADGKQLRYDTLDDILDIINKAKRGR